MQEASQQQEDQNVGKIEHAASDNDLVEDWINQTPEQRLEAQAVDAMREVIKTKGDVENAVTRADIGQIDFVWGSEGGAIDAKGKRKAQKG